MGPEDEDPARGTSNAPPWGADGAGEEGSAAHLHEVFRKLRDEEREEDEARRASGGIDGPVGIGGWLVLPAIGLLVGVLLLTRVLAEEVRLLWGERALDADLRTLVAVEMVGNALLLASTVAALYFFFGKKRQAPHWFIGVLVASAAFRAFNEWHFETVYPGTFDGFAVARGVIPLFVWVPYFLSSQRVRNTFVN